MISRDSVPLSLHLGDPAFIRSPAFNRVNTVYIVIMFFIITFCTFLLNLSFKKGRFLVVLAMYFLHLKFRRMGGGRGGEFSSTNLKLFKKPGLNS